MVKLSQVVIVEGKYDKIRLSSFLDAEIITTDGFRIFKDKEKVEMLRRVAQKKGVIILTDRDSAGFLIRGHLTGVLPNDKITNVFIPEIKGKERRKTSASAEGLLGVEGLNEEVILKAFKIAGIDFETGAADTCKGEKITRQDLYNIGLSGNEDSRSMREQFLRSQNLPTGMSTSQMLTALNSLFSRREFLNFFEKGE